ncbi:EamA family transporter [Saccharothrix syringae]|uniref:EamA family transporter n=1 Tax=Saccharothrix syringae TaxID=103733 RepID=A0A5Q0HET0_SACSY|nr:EamA family transporter [Saccharothrix syringae]
MRWALITAIAPVAWGATYYVTHHFLPADHPLWGAVLRALPAGLLLLLLRRELPRGPWWWRSAVLGTLNTGAFFALVYLAAQLLPTSLASTIMATSPVVMIALAWPLLGERPRARAVLGAAAGVFGVVLVFASGVGPANPVGVLASVAAMAMSTFGHVLTKRWGAGSDVLSVTSWQLVAGGLVLVVPAIAVEGAPPALTWRALLGFAFVSVVGTALAFAAWFAGLRHLEAGAVGLIGLLNPVTGVLLGVALAGERLTGHQLLGLALVLSGVVLGQRRTGARPSARLSTSPGTSPSARLRARLSAGPGIHPTPSPNPRLSARPAAPGRTPRPDRPRSAPPSAATPAAPVPPSPPA